MKTRHPLGSAEETGGGPGQSIRRLIPDPMSVFLLGFLSIPGYLVESLAFLQPFVLFFLAGFWPIVVAIVQTIRGTGTNEGVEDEDDPTNWIDMGGRAMHARAIISSLIIQFQPILLVTGTLQFVGHLPILARHRGSLPAPVTHESEVDYRLPFEGTWTVVNGSPDRAHSHSWGCTPSGTPTIS